MIIEPFIKVLREGVDERPERLYSINDLNASSMKTDTTQTIHQLAKKFTAAVGMVIKNKKSDIKLSIETPLPNSLQDIPRIDETTYKYFGYETIREVEVACPRATHSALRIAFKVESLFPRHLGFSRAGHHVRLWLLMGGPFPRFRAPASVEELPDDDSVVP